MKTLSVILFILIFKTGFSQNNLIGNYFRRDSKISINSDSSFYFLYKSDMYRSWSKGFWTQKGKRIFLKIIPVFDTVTVLTDSSKPKDSLVLSRDEKPGRLAITKMQEFGMYEMTIEQNERLCPKKMRYKKGRLYVIKKGKLLKKKIKSGILIHPIDPWYEKENEYYRKFFL